MTMRSTPPCSANLAEMPVPAPAPMIGEPLSRWARRRRSASSRGMNGMVGSAPKEAQQLVRQGAGERFVVKVQVELANLHSRAGMLPQRFEQGTIGLGVVERLPL